MNNKLLNFINEFLMLLIGCLLMAISLNVFYKPHSIAPGGITGLAIVINSVTGISLPILNLCFNIPLFLIAYKVLSKKDIVKTLLGVILLTSSLQLTLNFSNINATNDPLLASIVGSVLCGLGLGLIFRINGSTGGTDLIGVLVNRFLPSIRIAVLMSIADFVVVVLSGVVSKNIEIALYSGLSLYIIVKASDIVIDGFNYSKSFTIISNNSEEISALIMKELGRGVTFLKGTGAYTREEKNVVLVVISKRQVVTLKRLIKSIDPNAFIIVSDINEAIGEGFSTIEI